MLPWFSSLLIPLYFTRLLLVSPTPGHELFLRLELLRVVAAVCPPRGPVKRQSFAPSYHPNRRPEGSTDPPSKIRYLRPAYRGAIQKGPV